VKIEALEAHNVSPEILAIWQDTIGSELHPLQQRAIKQFGLLHGHSNLVIAAPPSATRMFLGEMAAVKAAQENQKALFVLPHPGLIERYEQLVLRYGRIGLKFAVSSCNQCEFDETLRSGEFQIAVVAIGKLQTLLATKPTLLHQVGLVVVDELQLVEDEECGPALELFLTKLINAGPGPRLVALSAPTASAHALASWLHARILLDESSAAGLRKGVLCQGKFTFRAPGSQVTAVEEMAPTQSDDKAVMLGTVLADLAVRRGEQVIVFQASRPSAVDMAIFHGERLHLPPARAALQDVREQEDTSAREMLLKSLEHGVAFLASDLTVEMRRLVESHFRSGSIRVLFSTSEMAVCSELVARNVISEAKRWRYFRQFDRWDMVDITRAEHETLSWRASGVVLPGSEFGRSILVTASRFQAEAWMRYYADRELDELVPAMKEMSLEDLILDLVVSGLAKTRESVIGLLLSSFTGLVVWRPCAGRGGFGPMVDKAIQTCECGGLLEEKNGKLAATELGHICAAKGLHVSTVIAFAEWARAAAKSLVSEIELVVVLSFSQDAEDIHLRLPELERHLANYPRQLKERAQVETSDRLLPQTIAQEKLARPAEERASKRAVLMLDWIKEAPSRELEDKYEIWSGAIARVGLGYAWMADGLSGIAGAVGWSDEQRQKIDGLAARLAFGVREDAVDIAWLHVPGFGRGAIRAAVEAGLKKPRDVRSKSKEELRSLMGTVRAADALWARLHPESTAMDHVARPVLEPAPALIPTPFGGELTRGEQIHALPDRHQVEDAPSLRFDKIQHRLWYRDIEVPTAPQGDGQRRSRRRKGEGRTPPNYLARQEFYVLMILASENQGVVRVGELAERLNALGCLKPGIAPELRNLKHRVSSTLRRILCPRGIPAAEINDLIVHVKNVGLRLRAGKVEVIGWPPSDGRPSPVPT
jgi:helicase